MRPPRDARGRAERDLVGVLEREGGGLLQPLGQRRLDLDQPLLQRFESLRRLHLVRSLPARIGLTLYPGTRTRDSWELFVRRRVVPANHGAGEAMRATLPAATLGGANSRQPDWFRALAVKTAAFTGRPLAFFTAVALIVLWGATGPLFHYSDTWQLVINTGTTIVTFLMVFLIQATQNRDAAAIQLKLDELLRAVETARNEMIDVERRSDDEIERLKNETVDAAR